MVFSPKARIHVEKNKRDKEYEELDKSPHSPFKDIDILLKDIFLIAMTMGYHKKVRDPLRGTPHDLFGVSTFNPEEEWLIKSVAIAEKENLEMLLEEKELLRTAEEYANAGILILYDIIFGGVPGDPLKKLETEVKDIYIHLSQSEV